MNECVCCCVMCLCVVGHSTAVFSMSVCVVVRDVFVCVALCVSVSKAMSDEVLACCESLRRELLAANLLAISEGRVANSFFSRCTLHTYLKAFINFIK
jgi:hypothetical protein